METSILYTFSTIAQALGGAFALLSAFVLFRFQSLDASMLNASVGLRSIWKTPGDLECYATLRGLSVWPALNLNLAGVGAFALCMISYLILIYAPLVSPYGKNII